MAKRKTAAEGGPPETATAAEDRTEAKNRPVEIKVGTALVKIWTNQRTDGDGVWHNVTVANLYKDGEQWKQGQSFGKKEIPNLIEALEQANRRLNGVTVSTPGDDDKMTRTKLDVTGQTKQVIEHGSAEES